MDQEHFHKERWHVHTIQKVYVYDVLLFFHSCFSHAYLSAGLLVEIKHIPVIQVFMVLLQFSGDDAMLQCYKNSPFRALFIIVF